MVVPVESPPLTDTIHIFFRSLDGSTVSLQLPTSAGAEALRAVIQQMTGIPAGEQRLVFADRALSGEQPLGVNGFNGGAENQLLVALKGRFDTIRSEATRPNGLETAEAWVFKSSESLA